MIMDKTESPMQENAVLPRTQLNMNLNFVFFNIRSNDLLFFKILENIVTAIIPINIIKIGIIKMAKPAVPEKR